MKRMKGQAALEYLVTYGWAILGILIVGLVLWQFGAFTPPSPPPGCSGFSEIKPLDWKASGTSFVMTITNEAGLKLNVTRINVSITDANCGLDPNLEPPNPDIEIRPGESYQSTVACSGLSSEYTPGEYYRAHIIIEYKNPQSEIEHKSKGECWGSVE